MRLFTLGLLALLVLMSGCARVADNLTKDLEPGDFYDPEIPPQKSPLKVEVKVQSSGPLTGCLYSAARSQTIETSLFQKKQPADALAYESGQASFTLTGTVPANEIGKIWLKNTGTEKATIQVKIVGY